jgi:hypothetical protein
MELEGVVSKRKESPYRSGRSSSWTKVTCRHRETFVLVGGKKFDGLYLGRREGKKLIFFSPVPPTPIAKSRSSERLSNNCSQSGYFSFCAMVRCSLRCGSVVVAHFFKSALSPLLA